MQWIITQKKYCEMKKYIPIFLAFLLAAALPKGFSQGCNGLKNPIAFSYYNNAETGRFSGMIGDKGSSMSACNNPDMTFTGTVINAANLANQTRSESLTFGNQPMTEADTNCADYQHFKIIHSHAIDPMTGYIDGSSNGLRYVPDTNEFTSSIRLGNYASANGVSADKLYYDFKVTYNSTLLTIWYAVVLENSLHYNNGINGNPEFILEVWKESTTTPGTYEYISDTFCFVQTGPATQADIAPQGFLTFHRPGMPIRQGCTNCEDCDYMPWHKVVINLKDYLYQKVRLVMISSDCIYDYDYGLAYIAGDCAPMELRTDGCAAGSADTMALVHAPDGLVSYQWYRCIVGDGAVTNDTTVAHYELIPGDRAHDSVFAVRTEDFVLPDGTTAMHRTFMCRCVSVMNKAANLPIVATLTATVNNLKPLFDVDSIIGCGNDVTLVDRSRVLFSDGIGLSDVDTAHTTWNFYESDTPAGTPISTATGGNATCVFSNAGLHSVVVRTPTFDPSCWNEKTIQVRSMTAPEVRIETNDQNICAGDSVVLSDVTPQSVMHHWVLTQDGTVVADTATRTASFQTPPLETTTTVDLYTHTNEYTLRDTNEDGEMERIYCDGHAQIVIDVQKYPTIAITGETTVCKGEQARVTATSDVAGTVFEWHEAMNGTTPVAEGALLAVELTGDKTFYVRAESTSGCVTWDSVTLKLVDPVLRSDKEAICTGESVTLWGDKAATYEWSASPYDISLSGQQGNDTIVVSPRTTTTYTLVGRGSNGCGATELHKKISVYDYPVPTVALTPGYVDSENPSVQFSDVSPNGTQSLWNFGDGSTSTTRSVVHTYTDLRQDSFLVSLHTCNPLNCCNDTSFFVPVGIFAVWFPNAFTPQMNSNTTFHAFTLNKLVDYELFVYNRQGAQVFHSVDPNEGWNGTCAGEACPMGSYVYIATYRRDDGSIRKLSQKGTVTLLR